MFSTVTASPRTSIVTTPRPGSSGLALTGRRTRGCASVGSASSPSHEWLPPVMTSTPFANSDSTQRRQVPVPDAALFSEMWRQKQIEYTWTHTLAGRYVEFWTLTQRALDYCFERFPSVDRKLRAPLLDAYLQRADTAARVAQLDAAT